MLNISKNSIAEYISIDDFKSTKLLKKSKVERLTVWLLSGLLLFVFVCMFLPWIQNISSKGYVTTRLPEQRPQGIQSVIAGRIEKWYVKEGDFVQTGDTIVFISEIKSEYFDPALLERTSEQLNAKALSVDSYSDKIDMLQVQYDALDQAFVLKKRQIENKLLQSKNKISIDSIDLVAFKTNLEIAENQLLRTEELEKKGLKTLTERQEKQYKVQQAAAKVNVQENKLINQKNDLQIQYIELDAIVQEYAEKMAKARSEMQSAISSKLETQAETSKLKNQLSNYSERQKFYYITAPQSGFITKTLKAGIGETIKEGIDIATIVPENYDLAIEIYVTPQDIPLIDIGNEVRLRLDGWPAIVISGWPEASTGIFTGNVVAIDRYISENGQYRILISPSEHEKPWPVDLRVGTGANAFILLNEVPIWYEVWRQLNGFPADYYRTDLGDAEDVKRKAPLKSVK